MNRVKNGKGLCYEKITMEIIKKYVVEGRLYGETLLIIYIYTIDYVKRSPKALLVPLLRKATGESVVTTENLANGRKHT